MGSAFLILLILFNMDIYAQKDNKETFANVEIVVPGDDEDETESDNVKLLTGLERSYAIDTAALLGGNEYLIKQMLEEIECPKMGSYRIMGRKCSQQSVSK